MYLEKKLYSLFCAQIAKSIREIFDLNNTILTAWNIDNFLFYSAKKDTAYMVQTSRIKLSLEGVEASFWFTGNKRFSQAGTRYHIIQNFDCNYLYYSFGSGLPVAFSKKRACTSTLLNYVPSKNAIGLAHQLINPTNRKLRKGLS
jgi:hypothetical protein